MMQEHVKGQHKEGGDKPGQNVDMEKLMKEMQEKLQKMKMQGDSANGKDDNE